MIADAGHGHGDDDDDDVNFTLLLPLLLYRPCRSHPDVGLRHYPSLMTSQVINDQNSHPALQAKSFSG